jgi:hypothetical protein
MNRMTLDTTRFVVLVTKIDAASEHIYDCT